MENLQRDEVAAVAIACTIHASHAALPGERLDHEPAGDERSGGVTRRHDEGGRSDGVAFRAGITIATSVPLPTSLWMSMCPPIAEMSP